MIDHKILYTRDSDYREMRESEVVALRQELKLLQKELLALSEENLQLKKWLYLLKEENGQKNCKL